MEMKMLRWMGGVTRLDRICNQDIRQRFGVAPITEKLREARLRWYGHVLRADNDSICKIKLILMYQASDQKGAQNNDGWTPHTPI
ncbi:hypothetical protein ANCDUO_17957 [Ancylostoma duodenale]|uniref:Reverse transcriptase domain-containing protein n=1 Tax=Ancylostoma duodenale TaxID=51022 RepID=A0A0C2C6N5_9BILA|nr:hypothetical protein ANCDUO_17957 [Ancylostoma duodenale]